MTRTLPARLPASPRSPPLVLTMPTPASVSDAPMSAACGQRLAQQHSREVTFATCPKFTSRPATAAVVSRTP